jgi:hypothetical protein
MLIVVVVKEKEPINFDEFFLLTGNDLLSQDPAVQVPSTLKGLTAVFGMGTGGSPSPLSPDENSFS